MGSSFPQRLGVRFVYGTNPPGRGRSTKEPAMQVEEHLRSVFGLRMGNNGKTVFGQARPLRIQDARVKRAFAPDPPGAFLTPVVRNTRIRG